MCFYSSSDKRNSHGACKMKTKLNSDRYLALKAERVCGFPARSGLHTSTYVSIVQYRGSESRAASATRSRI